MIKAWVPFLRDKKGNIPDFFSGIYSAVGCLVKMSTVSFKSDEHLLVIVFTSDCKIVLLSIFQKWL